MTDNVIIIPTRLEATRLPNKPLKKINNKEMILHVHQAAKNANIGEVIVAAEDQEIIDDVKRNGGQAVLTTNKHKTGTDRIYEALKKLNYSNIDLIMNLQGDEPLMNIDDIKKLNNQMNIFKSEMGTLASKISNKELYENQNIVKVITKEDLNNLNFPEAKNFMRKVSNKTQNIYHHLGIYCYQNKILKKIISLNQSSNEIKNNLEQFRALDNNININVALAKKTPIGIDTKEDYLAIKKIMKYK